MKKIPIAFAMLACAGALHATPACNAPKDKWLPEAGIKLAMLKQGFLIRTFTVRNGCYAIAGVDKMGHPFDIYLDPATGETIED